MKLYRIRRVDQTPYDAYHGAVVRAPDVETARRMHPGGEGEHRAEEWCSPALVMVDYLGEAEKGSQPSVVLASYNAG